MSTDARTFWDDQAATFDQEPDHGLLDPTTRRAWADLLVPLVPPGSSVVDLGCGTGSLSALLAEAGHDVRGLDLSPRMVEAAKAKAPGAHFTVGDAAAPPYPPASADVVLARHVLWALPDPGAALRTWVSLLRPRGRLVLVEGHWSTGAGLSAGRTTSLVREIREEALVTRLTEPALWGREIDDERYLVLSTR